MMDWWWYTRWMFLPVIGIIALGSLIFLFLVIWWESHA